MALIANAWLNNDEVRKAIHTVEVRFLVKYLYSLDVKALNNDCFDETEKCSQ
jgi:hypothetical protein